VSLRTTVSQTDAAIDVPDQSFESDVTLTAATRGNYVESVYRGTLAVADADGSLVVTSGDPRQRIFMRSSAKPFQAMALILTGAADALDLAETEVAIAAASHSGEPEHIEAVLELLEKGKVPSDALQCGVHAPLNPGAARRLVESRQEPSVLHNNCSGKHAGMLIVCSHMGWPLQSYREPSHPLQQLNLATLAAFFGGPPGEIGVAVDGCGVPAFRVSVAGVATAFARLATGAHVDPVLAQAAQRVRDAMMAHPYLVAGRDRFDTELMTAGRGSIVCKGGAQGVEGIGLVNRGLGLAMKISDGSSGSIGPVAYRALEALGTLDPDMKAGLAAYREPELRNHAGTVVGSVKIAFSVDGNGR